MFAQIRLKNSPERLGRQSRFKGSHLGGAWLVLFMIFNVIWTMFLFRGAASAAGNLPYDNGAFVSIGIGNLLDGLSHDAIETLEHVGLLMHIGIMLVFLILVLNSKHLHIFLAPLNVLFKRKPIALGAVKPLMSDGKAITLDDVDDLDEDSKLGVGAVEDFSWKGLLDFSTCTECGRCQSQCPAWNTEKPLSPKLLIMALRDASYAKAPYTLAPEGKRDALLEGNDTLTKEAERPLVGDTGDDWFYMPEDGSGVIDPDVLWSCVTCGACVEQCPVDIEHVDHIVDMRRYQVLVESNFPAELNQLFKGMENKGNPWNMSATARMDWAKDLDFDVKVVGDDIESLDEVEWLFWVGCAGAYEDRAKKTTRAVAELLDMAGVSFGVLGNGETCSGDQARRAGNEFLFQGLAQQNVETFKEYKVKKVVSTCAHCFNTLKNEYQEFGIELEVVHHTQLLNRLVREGKLTPVKEGAGAAKRSITYHDPCYIGRHNGVYTPPRELLEILPGADFVEMPRNSEKSFCCGAGGARMWMEENIGERINVNRTIEAVETGADQIAVGCPFCRVMLSDGLTAQQAKGEAREEVEVLDVAQMLLASVKGEVATRTPKPAGKATTAKKAAATRTTGRTGGGQGGGEGRGHPGRARGRRRHPDRGHRHRHRGRRPRCQGQSGGSSLFDLGGDDEPEAKDDPAPDSEPDETPVEPVETPEADDKPKSGGSLFDLEAPAEPEAKAKPRTRARSQGRAGTRQRTGRNAGRACRDPRRAQGARGRSGRRADLGDPRRRITLRHRGPRTRRSGSQGQGPRARAGTRGQRDRSRAGTRQRTGRNAGRACRDPRSAQGARGRSGRRADLGDPRRRITLRHRGPRTRRSGSQGQGPRARARAELSRNPTANRTKRRSSLSRPPKRPSSEARTPSPSRRPRTRARAEPEPSRAPRIPSPSRRPRIPSRRSRTSHSPDRACPTVPP